MTVIAPPVASADRSQPSDATTRYRPFHRGRRAHGHGLLGLTPTGQRGTPLSAARRAARRPALALGLLALTLLVVLSACTGDRLEGASKGWSPAGVSSQLQDSRIVVAEGRPFSESDSTLTVSGGSAFTFGQTIVLGSEQLVITSIVGSDLRVTRGANGTLAQTHPDGAVVSVLTDDVVTVYVTTKQGDLKALEDDGFGPPVTRWTFRPLEARR